MVAIGGILYLAIIVFLIASMWKIYVKAGQPGWAAIVPIYNFIVLLQVVKKPLWWIALLFVPIANIVILIMVYNELSKSFGKSVGFTVGLIFLPMIFFPILGFGDAQYIHGDNDGQEGKSLDSMITGG